MLEICTGRGVWTAFGLRGTLCTFPPGLAHPSGKWERGRFIAALLEPLIEKAATRRHETVALVLLPDEFRDRHLFRDFRTRGHSRFGMQWGCRFGGVVRGRGGDGPCDVRPRDPY